MPCASKEEIDKFAFENLVVVQARFGYLNLQSQEEVVKYNIENLLYSSASSATETKGQDINVKQNLVELKDDVFGFVE